MPGTDITYIVAASAGVLSFISPCVLPLVPGYLGILSRAAVTAEGTLVADRRMVLAHAASFVLGFSLIFTALGASVGLFGYAVRDYALVLQRLGGLILVVFGLHTLGLLQIPFLNTEVRLQMRPRPELGLLSSLMIGMIFAAGWTPCIGVILSGILALAATSGTVWQGAGLLLVYSLGLGIPFLLCALGLDRARGILSQLNRHGQLVERISGAFLVVMGVLIFFNIMAILAALFTRWFGNGLTL